MVNVRGKRGGTVHSSSAEPTYTLNVKGKRGGTVHRERVGN